MSISKLVTRILSALLAVICLGCLVSGAIGLKDLMDVKNYWEKTGADALAQFQLMEDGIRQLMANEDAYLTGVTSYEEGLEAYEAGQAQLDAGRGALAAGQADYDAGAQRLAEGQAAYDEGAAKLEQAKKDLAEGEKQLAEGKKQLEDNRQAYEEGKATLAEVEPIYNALLPELEKMDNLKAQYDQAVADGDMVTAAILEKKVTEQQLLLNTKLGGTSINDLRQQIEDGKAKIAEYEAGEAKVAEGEKKVAEARQQIAEGEKQLAASGKQLEEGRQSLAEGASALEAGRAELAQGEAALAEGEQQLKEGEMQLALFENGELQLKDGLDRAIAQPTYLNAKGEPLVRSIAERLGEGFSYYKLDEYGQPLEINDEAAIDLNKAMQVLEAGRAFVSDTSDVVTNEMVRRVIALAVAVLTAVLGLIAAVIGLCGAPLGSAVTATLGHFQALLLSLLGFLLLGGMELPMSRIAGSKIPGLALILGMVLCVVLLLHAINTYVLAYIRHREKKAAAPVYAAPAAPAPAAEAPAAKE